MIQISKIENDKYYTPISLANACIDKVLEIIGRENISEVVEPSVGNGAFLHNPNLYVHFGYDIQPECDAGTHIIKGDYLTQDITYLYGRLVIGNPPFGYSNNLAIKFFNKSCEIADYVAFILPISQLDNNLQFYKFDLIYSEDLGIVEYSGIPLHCCFNIFKRPISKELNPKPNVTLKDVTIIEHRRKQGNYTTAKNKDIAPNFDYAMCNWGNGCLGKVPEYIGQYAQEVYFYIHNPLYRDKILELLQTDVIRNYVSSISAKKISVARLYIYLKKEIPELI